MPEGAGSGFPRCSLEDVWVAYPTTTQSSLKAMLLGKRNPVGRKADALRGISLELVAPVRLGLVGRNGAGKSTLLRIMAGILPHSRGVVDVRGDIGTLLGDGVGYEMEMSGWENIYTQLLMRGLDYSEARSIQASVADSAALGSAIHDPMRTYSSGMVMRIGFAVATSLHPQILLMDEFLGTGDEAFNHHAQARLEAMMDAASIVVLASHNLTLLSEYCDTGAWLEAGEVQAFGPMSEVAGQYREASRG